MSSLKSNNSSTWKATAYTLLAQALFMLVTLYINYWITKNWAVEGFATYNLLKRLGTFLLFPTLVGMGIGIPKFISLQKTKRDSSNYEYLVASFLVFLGSFSLLALGLLLFKDLLVQSFELAPASFTLLYFAILLFTFSQGLFQLITAYYRGQFQFVGSSLLHVLLMTALPLGLLFVSQSVLPYYQKYGLISSLVLLGLGFMPWKKYKLKWKAIQVKMQRLTQFGAPRIVGELCLFGLEFLPIFALSLFVGLKESAYLAMCFLVLKLGAVPFELYGSVIMPFVGKELAQGKRVETLNWLRKLQVRVIALATVGFAGLYFITPYLIRQFYPELSPSIAPTQYILLVMPFYVNYLILRQIIDLLYQKAYNTYHLILALGLQLVLLAWGIWAQNPLIYQTLAIALPFVVLGICTEMRWLKTKNNQTYGVGN